MKKALALIMSALMLFSIFAGCNGRKQAQAPDGSGSDIKQPDTSTADSSGLPELVYPWEANPLNGSYISPEVEAIITVAKAYLARGIRLQYECSNLVKSATGVKSVTRCQYHVNTPEDCTSQNTGYTNCSAFTYDVFWEAFGLDIKANGCSKLRDAVDMHVFTYYITGNETPYERRLVEQNFLNSMQQGDIIVCNHNAERGGGGHALLYIGDGMLIDSAYMSTDGGGNFDHSANFDKLEIYGSVRDTCKVTRFFDEDYYYYFWGKEVCWSIVRPLKKYTNAKITYKTQARIENLKDIYIEKQSSHAVGQTVDIGEEITFTYFIRNDRDTEATLQATAQVPANTEYVSGGDYTVGKSIKWEVKVPAGQEVKVSYTVKVKSDPALYGTAISGEGSAIGGVELRCRDIFVGKHLSQKEMDAISSAGDKSSSMAERGIELAKAVYKSAGINIDLPDVNALLDSLFVQYKSTTHFSLNADSKYAPLVAPTMYGGYLCVTSDKFGGDRTYGIYRNQIYTGDIIVAREKTDVYAYMLLDGNKVLNLTNGKIIKNADARDTLLSLIGRDVFAVVRPSAAK